MSYRHKFVDPDDAKKYDEKQYGSGSWASLLWRSERAILDALLTRDGFLPRRMEYLDFACGTGRLAGRLSHYFESTHGVDISESMLGRARLQHPAIQFQRLDVNVDTFSGAKSDLITCFRFMLNADPLDRESALRWMHNQLQDDNSRVIVNNHSNLLSHKVFPWLIRAGWRRNRLTGNVLSHRRMTKMSAEAGFRVQAVHGTGFIGGHALKVFTYDRMEKLNDRIASVPGAQRIGEDQLYVLAPE